MSELKTAYICDYIRTPIGRFGGTLASKACRAPRS